MDAATGEAHGQESPWRWDHSVAFALILLGALALLGIIRLSFSTSFGAGLGG